MNIIVLVKQVPDTSEVKINRETNTLIREGVPSIINPFDMYAIEEALRDKLQRLDRTRLARELTKLDPEYEKSLAEEGIGQDRTEWPEF